MTLEERLRQLRDAFDDGFAQAPAPAAAPGEAVIEVRVGADAFALRRSQVGRILRGGPLAAVPGGDATLLGLAEVEGALVAVYAARVLVREAMAPTADVPAWFVTVRSRPSRAYAFDAVGGLVLAHPGAAGRWTSPAGPVRVLDLEEEG